MCEYVHINQCICKKTNIRYSTGKYCPLPHNQPEALSGRCLSIPEATEEANHVPFGACWLTRRAHKRCRKAVPKRPHRLRPARGVFVVCMPCSAHRRKSSGGSAPAAGCAVSQCCWRIVLGSSLSSGLLWQLRCCSRWPVVKAELAFWGPSGFVPRCFPCLCVFTH